MPINDGHVVRIRGLPFSAREDEVIKFFYDCEVKGDKFGVCFTFGRDGRPSGEAYVVFNTAEDIEKAMQHNNEHMGKRYIEVFKSDLKEMEWATGKINTSECVLKLRGLPFDVDKMAIAEFFKGLELASNGIGLLLDRNGRSTGEAFVQFASAQDTDQAKEKHMEKIGHRYIEIFRSNMTEANNAIKRQIDINLGNDSGYGNGNYGGGGGGRYGGGGMNMGGNRSGGGGMNRPGPYNRPQMGGGGGNMMGGGMRGNVKGMGGGNSGSIRPLMGMDFNSGFGGWESTTGHSVHMRGLPFAATEDDILSFLAPLQPVNIQIHMNNGGRPTGEGDVDFASHDEAKEAMKKDREKIGSRYIELFLNSSPVGRTGGGSGFNMSRGGGGGGGGGGGIMGGGTGGGMNMMGGGTGGSMNMMGGGTGGGMNMMGGGGYGNAGGGFSNDDGFGNNMGMGPMGDGYNCGGGFSGGFGQRSGNFYN